MARFDRDVIAQPGVRYLIVLDGINDIGMLARTGEVPQAQHDALVRRIIGAYQQIIDRAHTYGIKVIGATIMPFVGSNYYHPGPAGEADRQAVNRWISDPGHFDAVIDFDKITRDPEHPDRLLSHYDCGDHLHPSPAGYAAMAQGVPFSIFAPPAESGRGRYLASDSHGVIQPALRRVVSRVAQPRTTRPDSGAPPSAYSARGLLNDQ